MSQFHNSKIVLKTRTLSKVAYPVNLQYKSFGGRAFTRKPRRLLSLGLLEPPRSLRELRGLKAHRTALRSSQRKPFALPAGVSRLSFQTVFGGLSIHAQAQSTS